MENAKYFVFDVESIGFHGPSFAVGWVILDELFVEIGSGFTGINMDPNEYLSLIYEKGHHATDEGLKFFMEKVWPVIQVDCSGQKIPSEIKEGWEEDKSWEAYIVEKFLQNWVPCKDAGAILVADCPYPVETNFLSMCAGYTDAGEPYPLIDVASVLLAAGMDPIGSYGREDDELPVHHPTADARQSARVFEMAMRKIASEKCQDTTK